MNPSNIWQVSFERVMPHRKASTNMGMGVVRKVENHLYPERDKYPVFWQINKLVQVAQKISGTDTSISLLPKASQGNKSFYADVTDIRRNVFQQFLASVWGFQWKLEQTIKFQLYSFLQTLTAIASSL
jgi:hypothetical protein